MRIYRGIQESRPIRRDEGNGNWYTGNWSAANDSEGIVSSGSMFHHEEIDFEEYSPSPPTFHHFDLASGNDLIDMEVDEGFDSPVRQEAVEISFRRERSLARERKGRSPRRRQRAERRQRKPRSGFRTAVKWEIAHSLVDLQEQRFPHWTDQCELGYDDLWGI
jgi:hypothetical protein